MADALAQHEIALPEPFQRQLLEAARGQVAGALRIKRLTLQVVDTLLGLGITPVLLKGYGLACRLYPEQPLGRPSSDVDVLVPRFELERAMTALSALGLREVVDAGLEDVFEEHHHLSLSGPPRLVEVHFRVFSGFGGAVFDTDLLLARKVEAVLDGRRVAWLAPPDEFVYLATHAANHAFLRASWLVDLVRFLKLHPDLPWVQMAADTRRAGFFEAVSLTLWLLESALGVQLPLLAATAFSTHRARRAADGRLFTAAQLESAGLSGHRIASVALRLWLVDSPRHGLRHLREGVQRAVRRLRSLR
jgi:hypothetical protein